MSLARSISSTTHQCWENRSVSTGTRSSDMGTYSYMFWSVLCLSSIFHTQVYSFSWNADRIIIHLLLYFLFIINRQRSLNHLLPNHYPISPPISTQSLPGLLKMGCLTSYLPQRLITWTLLQRYRFLLPFPLQWMNLQKYFSLRIHQDDLASPTHQALVKVNKYNVLELWNDGLFSTI